MKTYTIINAQDGNDTFEVEAKNANDAAHKALEKFGWWVAKNEQDDVGTNTKGLPEANV